MNDACNKIASLLLNYDIHLYLKGIYIRFERSKLRGHKRMNIGQPLLDMYGANYLVELGNQASNTTGIYPKQ